MTIARHCREGNPERREEFPWPDAPEFELCRCPTERAPRSCMRVWTAGLHAREVNARNGAAEQRPRRDGGAGTIPFAYQPVRTSRLHRRRSTTPARGRSAFRPTIASAPRASVPVAESAPLGDTRGAARCISSALRQSGFPMTAVGAERRASRGTPGRLGEIDRVASAVRWNSSFVGRIRSRQVGADAQGSRPFPPVALPRP